MKKFFFCIAIALIATLYISSAQQKPDKSIPPAKLEKPAAQPKVDTSGPQPKLEIIGGDTYDWGNVISKTEPLVAKIKYKNTGSAKLVITDVKPGCGCTTAKEYKKELNPGEESTFEFTFKPGGAVHNVTKNVKITSNDPFNATKYIYLKANIVSLIEFSPTTWFAFGEMQIDKEKTATLKLKNNSDQNIKFYDFVTDPPEKTKFSQTTIELKPQEEIEIKLQATATKTGSFNCSVMMKTSHPEYPTYRIEGFGKVKEVAEYPKKEGDKSKEPTKANDPTKIIPPANTPVSVPGK
jgi:uncharacterized cupredoxin-like copper-binding protein